MAVKLKKSEKDNEKVTIVNFNKDDFMAVEGIGKFFPGKVKSLHRYHAEKLIALKRAKKVNVELDENKSPNRVTRDAAKTKTGR